MTWDPVQYGRYADERSRPFFDLIRRIDADAPRRVIDLGCGPGNLTAVLAERWPGSVVEGIDSSPEMIEQAQARRDSRITFRLRDVADFAVPPDGDVVVSNATLQWVPRHQDLLRQWASDLPPGGWLAFQVPGNFDAPSHRLMRDVAHLPRWSAQLGRVLRHHDAVWSAPRYADLLLEAGLLVDAWETTYVHVLTGPDPVLEWVRGTGLRPVLAALSPDEAAEFEAEYAPRLRQAYPQRPYGTLFPFHRVFAVARRPG
jgi:trans-aconitate 2-methyltransferase